uniref:Uncharacterized protein n=1 Tax=Oryza brachyantha TaxID=4533 RepID=J3MMU7_ORYBR
GGGEGPPGISRNPRAGGGTLGAQGDLGAVLAGQIGLKRKGFRLSRKHSMKQPPTAAAATARALSPK